MEALNLSASSYACAWQSSQSEAEASGLEKPENENPTPNLLLLQRCSIGNCHRQGQFYRLFVFACYVAISVNCLSNSSIIPCVITYSYYRKIHPVGSWPESVVVSVFIHYVDGVLRH